MKTFNKILAFGALACGSLAMSATASAALVQCDDPVAEGDSRYMVLSDMVNGPATCHLTASGNDSNQDPWQNWDLLWKIEFDPAQVEGPGPDPFVTFTGGQNTTGSVSLIDGLTDHYLVFKFGEGKGDPDVFSFELNGMTYANWELLAIDDDATLNNLSHVSVYGPPPTTVPEPTTLALLGLGLLGLGYRARRHQAA